MLRFIETIVERGSHTIVAYRVEELAAAAEVSVELVRSYQTKGLLDPPRRDGRVALYDDRHLERLRAIRELKDKGYSLKAIGGLLSRHHADAQRTVPPLPPVADDDHLAPQELADRTRVPLAVLRSLEASGVIRARPGSGGPYYTGADVRAVRMLLSLLGVGLPMEEFMQLARLQIATMQEVAAGAVELYSKYVGEPLRSAGLDPHEEGERAEAAFGLLVQAATSLVAYSFERMLRNAWAAEKAGLR
ncbi:MAG TPA: MerR family transcriptional regulator [Acidimicrobiia bacterium]|nr:MerR family transcriptional regulator [Acidimicrobiia bacterium]